MTLIKLDAIDSTNDFLKQLAATDTVANYTAVVAANQTKGKGQMGSQWLSESGKNLTISILIKESVADISQIFTLNVAIAKSLIEVLQKANIPDLSIKWPNDIMSANKKIAGILIENSIKSNGTIQSIIGIGVNVNQEQFEGLPHAASLKLVSGQQHDIDLLITQVMDAIHQNTQKIPSQSKMLWESYHSYLYKIGQPVAFENLNGERFMGIIQGVNPDGILRLLQEEGVIRHFGIKQIKMLL